MVSVCGCWLGHRVAYGWSLRMWGSGVTPKAPSEAHASMTGRRLIDQNHITHKNLSSVNPT
nr:hypothetical protein [Candidatus Freyrarchaeum guaymaensis]